jgi:hypothetical protein
MEMAFACKKCKKAFRKDMNEFDESDEYCRKSATTVSRLLIAVFTSGGYIAKVCLIGLIADMSDLASTLRQPFPT